MGGRIQRAHAAAVGQTERAATQKASARAKPNPIDISQWVDKHIAERGDEAVHGAEAFMAIMEELGGIVELSSAQGSIYGKFRSENGTPYYPLHLTNAGRITLSFNYLLKRPKLIDESARRAIYDTISDAVGPLSTTSLQGYPGFNAAKLADPKTRANFAHAAQHLIDTARAD